MATANEKFSDALLRRQIQLLLFSNGLSRDVIRLLDETEDEVRAQLATRLRAIVKRGFDTGPDTTSRLKLLAETIKDIRAGGFSEAKTVMSDTLQSLVRDEAAFVDKALVRFSPVLLDTIVPAAATLGAVVSSTPFLGKTLKSWASDVAANDLDRIMQAVRQGLVLGEDSDQIAQRVFGLEVNNGSDGTVETTRREAQAISRTAVTAVSNEARNEYFQANEDVFDEEVYVATLDSKTTPLCRSLDGNRYKVGEGPIPGRDTHWNCRSVRVALIGGSLLGDRPAAAWSEDMLDGLSSRARAAKIRELTGTVPAATTYQEWLTDQTVAFQDSVLGPKRGKLFRDGGLTLKSFVDNDSGDQWTLEELRRREPQAFGDE